MILFFQLIGFLSMPVLHLCRLQGKSQIVQDELVRLGEQMVQSSEGTRALALELCREFEDKFLLHVTSGEVRVSFFVVYMYSY
jgi:dynamin GTPase